MAKNQPTRTSSPVNGKKRRHLTSEQREQAVSRYRGGESPYAIGPSLGVSVATIYKLLWKRNIPRTMHRRGVEALLRASQQKRKNDGLTGTTRSARRRKAAGLCPRCGHPNSGGKYFCLECREKQCQSYRDRKAQGLCRSCRRPVVAVGRTRCFSCVEYHRQYARRLKAEVIAGYGGKCICCGETELIFLAIDHVNNDGAAARRASSSNQGTGLYSQLRRQSYPSGFQVLCHNCNFAKSNGGCPHQHRRS